LRLLQDLKLQNSNLIRIEELKHIVSLTKLDVSQNKLTNLDFCFGLKYLRYLDASSNRLTLLENLELLSPLQQLKLGSF